MCTDVHVPAAPAPCFLVLQVAVLGRVAQLALTVAASRCACRAALQAPASQGKGGSWAACELSERFNCSCMLSKLPLGAPYCVRRHLRDLLHDQKRSDLLYHEHKSEHGTLIADFSRQRVTEDTLKLLIDLANKVRITGSGFYVTW